MLKKLKHIDLELVSSLSSFVQFPVDNIDNSSVLLVDVVEVEKRCHESSFGLPLLPFCKGYGCFHDSLQAGDECFLLNVSRCTIQQVELLNELGGNKYQ